LFPALVILGAVEAHHPQIFLQRSIGFGVGQDCEIDDDIDIAGSRVSGHFGRSRADKIPRRETTDEED
ncbi:hypothetical protein, partial [Pseudomonas sp. FW306-02-F08-AA]|uniref:hypothetical protein n=1 Tax=Pseudomonas sp. FW306-02-F08-AA TaxID=2070651 RepID=UPI0015709ED5